MIIITEDHIKVFVVACIIALGLILLASWGWGIL